MTTHKHRSGLYLVLTLLLTLAATIPARADNDEIAWLGDYREALRQARQTHKPIFLEFRCEA